MTTDPHGVRTLLALRAVEVAQAAGESVEAAIERAAVAHGLIAFVLSIGLLDGLEEVRQVAHERRLRGARSCRRRPRPSAPFLRRAGRLEREHTPRSRRSARRHTRHRAPCDPPGTVWKTRSGAGWCHHTLRRDQGPLRRGPGAVRRSCTERTKAGWPRAANVSHVRHRRAPGGRERPADPSEDPTDVGSKSAKSGERSSKDPTDVGRKPSK